MLRTNRARYVKAIAARCLRCPAVQYIYVKVRATVSSSCLLRVSYPFYSRCFHSVASSHSVRVDIWAPLLCGLFSASSHPSRHPFLPNSSRPSCRPSRQAFLRATVFLPTARTHIYCTLQMSRVRGCQICLFEGLSSV